MFDNGIRATLDAIDRSQGRIEFDMDGNVLTANILFLDLIEYSANEIQGRPHSLLVPADERDSPAYRQLWERLRKGEFQAREFRRISKNGREIWIHTNPH